MMNDSPDDRINGIAIREIEAALDSATLLSLDLAIQTFERDDYSTSADQDKVKAIARAAEHGLNAAGMIERLVNNLNIRTNQR